MQRPDVITASQLAGMLLAGQSWLKIHVDRVNALNVFPVADGDTGINMLLTMQAALAEIDRFLVGPIGLLAGRVSQGALLGARGNSGVILSQILRGFAEAIQAKETISSAELAGALQAAADRAYEAVFDPIEGTMLTIIKTMAQTARQFAQAAPEMELFLSHILQAARQTLALTPSLLPVLQEAGVVDAGGQGLVYLLEGMARYLKGLPVDALAAEIDSQAIVNGSYLTAPGYRYDIQFLIRGEQLEVEAIRETINTMGASPLVVGNHKLVKVHLHAAEPDLLLRYGAAQGTLLDVVVEDMAAQYQHFLAKQQQIRPAQIKTAAICVAAGPGLAQVFKSLGADIIINNGLAAKPGRKDFLEAINQAPADNVLILPNDANLFLTAQQSGHLAQKQVRVLPTRSAPQGVSALLAFNAAAGLETNFERMRQAAQQVYTLEVVRAAQFAGRPELPFKPDDLIALADGRVAATGQDLSQVSAAALRLFRIDQLEMLTIYYGVEATPTAARSLAESIRAAYPHLEIEVLPGGQPHPLYIISLE